MTNFSLTTSEAQARIRDVEDTVGRIKQNLSDYESQTEQLQSNFQGQTAHTFQTAAGQYQSDMADVMRTGDDLVQTATDAIHKLVSADSQ